jgi:three-Cys-motif partner protein
LINRVSPCEGFDHKAFAKTEKFTYTSVYVMPKRDLNKHFDERIPEWTERKHILSARYFVPAAAKMKKITGSIAMVDGYAGPNMYGGEIRGSTVIMVDAARKVVEQGYKAQVFVCESDSGRFASLVANLSEAIEEGVLTVFNSTHAEAVPKIQKTIGSKPALVFLDPQTSSEMTLAHDIKPWAQRRSTDVLGVFMGGDACRVTPSLLQANSASTTMLASLGDKWTSAKTEDEAYRIFTEAIAKFKRYSGLYRLRKQARKKSAYGIFGLSDSPHGIWLLSEAAAKDNGILKDYDGSRQTENLFTQLDAEAEEQQALEDLISICRPLVEKDPTLRGAVLGIATFSSGLVETFGKYVAADYTRAAKTILAEQSRSTHA